jgi:hypothetical protein
MVEHSEFADFFLPLTYQMATTVTDSINYHLDKARSRSGLHALHSTLTAAWIDVANFPTEAALSSDGLDGAGVIAKGHAGATFTNI